jgi:hypothetical protein
LKRDVLEGDRAHAAKRAVSRAANRALRKIPADTPADREANSNAEIRPVSRESDGLPAEALSASGVEKIL